MGNKTSVTTTIRPNSKTTHLVKSVATSNGDNTYYLFPIKEINKINFNDRDWADIKETGYRDLDFCILDNGSNGISECMGLFSSNVSSLDEYAVTKGPVSCKGFYYRPGMVFDPSNDFDEVKKEIDGVENGKLCRLVYQDYNYDDNDMLRCCFTDNKNKCNKNLINGYTTSHCNIIMQEQCVGNEDDPKCMLWLEQNYDRAENVALEFYMNYCSKHHDTKTCSYFCKEARKNNDYRSTFCDRSLINFCNNNTFNSNCFCVITPSDVVPDIETYLGPKECWLSNCASQSDSKWLLTEQRDTRQKCNLTSCVISIDHLILKNNAKAEFINECVSGASVSSAYSLTEKKKTGINIEKTPGVLFNPALAILSLTFILLIK